MVAPPVSGQQDSTAVSFDLAGVVLAAGSGTRLAPLTLELPKAMCPVGGVPLIDRAIAHLSAVPTAATIEIAVNAHGSQRALIDHLDERVHLSIEDPDVLGTGGALARLSRWIDARPVCLVNADAVHDADLQAFVDSWDHERHHFLLAGTDEFAPGVRLCAVLMPARSLSTLVDDGRAVSVYDEIWKPAAAQQRVSVRRHDGACTWRRAPPGRDDVVTVDGVPMTRVAQALRECQGTVMADRLADAAGEAVRRGLVRRREAAGLLAEINTAA